MSKEDATASEQQKSEESTTLDSTTGTTFTADQFVQYTQRVIKDAAEKWKEIKAEDAEEIKKIKNSVAELKIENDNLRKDLRRSTSNSFAILSIFATVFIFISFNVNIFQSVGTASEAVFFMLIIAFACGFIVSAPLILIHSFDGHGFKNSKFLLGVLGLSLAALLMIHLTTYFGNNFEINIKDPLNEQTEENLRYFDSRNSPPNPPSNSH